MPSDDNNVIPNRQTTIRVLQEFVKLIKKQHARLENVELNIYEFFTPCKEVGATPFELYEFLLRDQLRLVDNITT